MSGQYISARGRDPALCGVDACVMSGIGLRKLTCNNELITGKTSCTTTDLTYRKELNKIKRCKSTKGWEKLAALPGTKEDWQGTEWGLPWVPWWSILKRNKTPLTNLKHLMRLSWRHTRLLVLNLMNRKKRCTRRLWLWNTREMRTVSAPRFRTREKAIKMVREIPWKYLLNTKVLCWRLC